MEIIRRLKDRFSAPIPRQIILISDDGKVGRRILEDQERLRDFLIPGVVNGQISERTIDGLGTTVLDFDRRDELGLPIRKDIPDPKE